MFHLRAAAAAALPFLLPALTPAQTIEELARQQQEAVESGALRVFGAPLRGHANYVMTVDVSPDGRRCVSAGWDGVAKVWDIAGDAPPLVLRGHDGFLQFAVFVDGGAKVVTSGEDETLRVFDAKSGEELRRIHLDTIHHAGAASPDGKRLASADQRADEVQIRDVATMGIVQRVPFAGSMQTQYAWSADGRYLVVGGALEPKVVVWDTEAQKVASELAPPSGVTSLAVRDDGHALAIGGYDILATFPFPVTGDEPSDTVSGMDSSVRGLTWKDSRTVVFGDDDGGMACVELEGPSLVWSVGEHRDTVQDLAVSPDGTFVASASHDQTVRFWNVADGVERFRVAGNRDMVQAVAWSADGKLVAGGDYGNVVALYDATSGAVIDSVLEHEYSVVAVAIPAGPRVVSAGQDDRFLWFDPSDTSERQLIALRDEELPFMIAGAFAGPEAFAGAFEDGSIRFFAPGDGSAVASVGAHEGPAIDVVWSPDGQLVASWGADGAVKLWKPDGQGVATLAEGLPESELCFAGDALAAGDVDGVLHILELDGGRKRHEIVVGTEEGEAVQELCASPDGTLVATFTAYRIALWSVESGELVGATRAYTTIPTSGAFSPDGKRLAVGGMDSTILVWDVAKLRGE